MNNSLASEYPENKSMHNPAPDGCPTPDSFTEESHGLWHRLYTSMAEGVAVHEISYDGNGQPVDYFILDVNPAFEEITGIPRPIAVGKKATELYGTSRPPYLDIYARVA
jgi:PAS domain-containing protein